MARIEIDRLGKRFGEVEVLRDLSLEIADGTVAALLGPSGCGKFDNALHRGRPLPAELRRRPLRRRQRGRRGAPRPQRRPCLPELRALPAPDSAREHRLPAEADEAAQGGDLEPGGRVGRAGRAGRAPRPQAERAVRRPAAARRGGARHRQAPPPPAHGRAAVQPRPGAARPHAPRDQARPARDRHHHDHRHPRSGRGHVAGRPHLRAQGRPPPAIRRPPRPLRPPGQPLRGRLHRQAGDEPLRRRHVERRR